MKLTKKTTNYLLTYLFVVMILVLLILLIRLVRKQNEPAFLLGDKVKLVKNNGAISLVKTNNGTTTAAIKAASSTTKAVPITTTAAPNTPVGEFIKSVKPYIVNFTNVYDEFLRKSIEQLNVVNNISTSNFQTFIGFTPHVWNIVRVDQDPNQLDDLFITMLHFFKIAIEQVLTGQDKATMINFVNDTVNPAFRPLKTKLGQLRPLVEYVNSDAWKQKIQNLPGFASYRILSAMQSSTERHRQHAYFRDMNNKIDPEQNMHLFEPLMSNSFSRQMQYQKGMMFPNFEYNDPTLPTELIITDY